MNATATNEHDVRIWPGDIGTDTGSETTLSRNSSTIWMINNNCHPPNSQYIFLALLSTNTMLILQKVMELSQRSERHCINSIESTATTNYISITNQIHHQQPSDIKSEFDRGIGTDAGSETTLSRNSSTIWMISNNQFPPYYRMILRHYWQWSSPFRIPSHSRIFHRTFARQNALLYFQDRHRNKQSGDETHGVTVSIADRWRYIPRWWVILVRAYRVLDDSGVALWIYI